MVVISRAWYNVYNGSYTMAARPIKSLELHYTMIILLLIIFVTFHTLKRTRVVFSLLLVEVAILWEVTICKEKTVTIAVE